MRAAYLLAFTASLAAALSSLFLLPARVAVHFGPGGLPDGWGSSTTHVAFLVGLHLILFGVFFFGHRLVLRIPPRWVNLPHKDYWLAPANRARAAARLRVFLDAFGAALFLFLLAVNLLSIQANLREPIRLDMRLFWPVMLAFAVFTVVWVAASYRAFRLPERDRP